MWILSILLVFAILPQIAAGEQPQGITVYVRGPLIPSIAAGRAFLAYEVDVENTPGNKISLVRVEVLGDSGTRLVSYEGNELAGNIRLWRPVSKDTRSLPPGAKASIFCWVEAVAALNRQHNIHHRVTYREGNGERVILLEQSAIAQGPLPILGPPLGDGDWWAAVGPSNTSSHRRAQVRIDGDGAAPFAQRYAVDWVKLCQGLPYARNGKDNPDYCGYGTPVLAVADGEVAAVKEGIPDNPPGENKRSVKMTVDTFAGNTVILSLGNNLFAIYAHLKPGSVQVKPGEMVHAGQNLALIGNSGNSDAPHLHFHVGKGSLEAVRTFQSDPVAYGFLSLTTIGVYKGRGGFVAEIGKMESDQTVLEGAVVRFPTGGKRDPR